MNTIYLLLGSNEGDRKNWLRQAVDALNAKAGEVVQLSALYETAAWGLEDQPDFLNQAVQVNTLLDSRQLLEVVQSIEQDLGRQRVVKWGQRTLDIDILFFNREMIDNPELKVPHPHLQERRFALQHCWTNAPIRWRCAGCPISKTFSNFSSYSRFKCRFILIYLLISNVFDKKLAYLF